MDLILEIYWSPDTFLFLLKWENYTLNEDMCTFLCMSWTLFLTLLFLFCRFFLVEIITNVSIITWLLTQVLVCTWNMIFLQYYYTSCTYYIHISYLNHIIHSMTCYTSVVQRKNGTVNSCLCYSVITWFLAVAMHFPF